MGSHSWNPEEDHERIMTTTLEALERRVAALELGCLRNSTTNTIVLDKELDRILARMETIRATYSSHQSWSQQDKDAFAKLRDRKREIKKLLGIEF